MGDRQMMASTTDDQAELRRRFIKAMREWEKVQQAAQARGLERWMPEWPRGPDMRLFSSLTCGARGKRTGKPCPLTCIYANGRCRFHGGLSTGPKTPEGREKASRNGRMAKVRMGTVSEPSQIPQQDSNPAPMQDSQRQPHTQ